MDGEEGKGYIIDHFDFVMVSILFKHLGVSCILSGYNFLLSRKHAN